MDHRAFAGKMWCPAEFVNGEFSQADDNSAPTLIAAGLLKPGQTVMDRMAADAFDDAAVPLSNDEARALNDAAFDGPAFEASMRSSVGQSDEEMMLEMIEDFIAVALNHYEKNGLEMSDSQARFSNLGITYGTYLADAIGQGTVNPKGSRKSAAIVERANAILIARARRPRIIIPNRSN